MLLRSPTKPPSQLLSLPASSPDNPWRGAHARGAAPPRTAHPPGHIDGAADRPQTLAVPISWVDDDGDLRFTAALDIDGVTEPRGTLFGRATAALPDRKVTLGLRWQDETSRGGNFDRLEWRPVKAHINRANAPPDLRLLVIEGSHHHPLALNAALDIGLIQAMPRRTCRWQCLSRRSHRTGRPCCARQPHFGGSAV